MALTTKHALESAGSSVVEQILLDRLRTAVLGRTVNMQMSSYFIFSEAAKTIGGKKLSNNSFMAPLLPSFNSERTKLFLQDQWLLNGGEDARSHTAFSYKTRQLIVGISTSCKNSARIPSLPLWDENCKSSLHVLAHPSCSCHLPWLKGKAEQRS